MVLKKGKSNSNSLSELHFVSSMPLDQSVILVEGNADEAHQVTLTQVSPDEYSFEIVYVPSGSIRAALKGTMQRWNSTETKVDADARGYNFIHVNKSTSKFSYFMIMLSMGFAIAEFISVFYWRHPWLPLVFFACFWLTLMLGATIETLIAEPRENSTDELSAKEAREYLFQKVIAAFKSNGDVQAV